MIKVPYYKQEFSWSCLPACVRMLLEFYDIKVEEKELRKLFGTTIEGGTNWSDVVKGIKESDVDFVYLRNQNLGKLKELVEKLKIPTIVSVDTRELGDFEHRNHTIVVVGVDGNYVDVHDPEKGPSIQLNINKFMIAWEKRLNRIGYIVKK